MVAEDSSPAGLDQIYVQAKRYGADNSVGREIVQAFVGAAGKNVNRGIFITTSHFTPAAATYADAIGSRVIARSL